MAYSFFAMLSRMKNIYRWALMRNTRRENIAEHSHEVAVLAHALALLHNRGGGEPVDPARCVLLAVYHDVPEILTGDMPTPVKYGNPAIREAYRQVERSACDKLLGMLPADLQGDYRPLLEAGEDSMEHRLVKAADKLSAYLKCVEELKAGNLEFKKAKEQTYAALLENQTPALGYFMEHFLDGFELTLDELT